jgi:hypothetical protein
MRNSRACQIQLRAERKAGQLLQSMEKARGGNPNLSRGATGSPTLDELGISRDPSSKWQRLATVPEDQFEAALTDLKISRRRTTRPPSARNPVPSRARSE